MQASTARPRARRESADAWSGGAHAVILQVKVKPRAKVSELSQPPDGTWTAKLKAPPADGKANEELIALVAERFGCKRAAVEIKSGTSGRTKLVRVNA
jgi:uncharacterized protein (TIGR00251 family)